MIGRLQGTLISKKAPFLLIDVQGVGYEVEASMTTFYELPGVGSKVTLHTHLVVREDAHLLFGFATETERTLFRTLIKVNGVGAKLALAILSGMAADHFVRCVQDNDLTTLTRLPGVGKKTAERLVVEMRDRLADWGGDDFVAGKPMISSGIAVMNIEVKNAISALVSLGYKPQEASRLVQAVNNPELPSEEIIRAALRAAVK